MHKKKVSDVSDWLRNVLSGRDKHKLLLLRGPAGSGKSTTISLLSKSLPFDLIPWQNPTSHDASTSGAVLSQFDDFLGRGAHFGSLTSWRQCHELLAILRLPTRSSLLRSFLQLDPDLWDWMASEGSSYRFWQELKSTAALPLYRSQTSTTGRSLPVVMLVSETLLSSSTAFSDSFTAHRLLGPEILNHPLVTVMDFNPVAPTFIHKALDMVAKKEARQSGRRRMPGAAVLQRLAEMGDVRNAINTLEFLCVRNEGDWSGTVASKTKKSAKDKQAMTEMEKGLVAVGMPARDYYGHVSCCR